jgi:dTDP-4-amino-4,6-dideoxygalactose transaminase
MNIYYGRQFVDQNDKISVNKALESNFITGGNFINKFENQIKKILKSRYALSCSSGTAAIHLSLLAIGLKKNDVIIMPSINFISVYNLSKIIGAKIFLTDVDPQTGQMTPESLIDCIKKNKLFRIKAIITMYLGGYPENIVKFYDIKKKYKCFLIEDACHALGAKYLYNRKKINIGSCYHSDICTFSLHPVKTITTGEGGIVTTNNKHLYNKILALRSHGIIRGIRHWKYNINEPGFNYRISDINCALGLSQLKKMKKFIHYRKKIFFFYKNKIKNNLITFPQYSKNISSFHLFLISIDFKKIKKTKDQFFIFLKKKKIFCQFHYIPIYKFKVFNRPNYYLRNSEIYYKSVLSLPIYYGLKLYQLKKIVYTINSFFKKS